MSSLAQFAGIVPTITLPLQVVTLVTPFTGLSSLPVIVLQTSMAVFAVAPPPSVACLHFGFWILRLVPPPTSIGLRSVVLFLCVLRLHNSMIGRALVQPWVLHDPWTYEPSRAMPYPAVHLLLRWFWSPFLPFFLGEVPCSAFVLV